MAKSTYVDGYVFVVPKKNIAKYRKMAREGEAAWRKFGALDFKECMGDDIKGMPGSKTTFPKLTKAKPGETVWFSFVTYKSKAHRDAVNKKVMAHFAKKYKAPYDMPMDPGRMAYGGFRVMVG